VVLPLLWVLLAGLALTLGWTTGAAAFSWIGYLMLTTWLVGLALARLGERGLVAERELSLDRMSHGGAVEVQVTVSNRSWLPVLWLVAAESLPAGLPMAGLRGRVGPLSGGGSFSFRYTLQGARRGFYELGPILLRTGDIFGLVQRERAAAGRAQLTVFPKVLPITHARLPSRRPSAEARSRQRVLEDPTQVVGIRPYQYGDGLRRVHWRATAHTGRLQSKLFEVSAQVENMLVLNLRRADYPDNPVDAQEAAELAVTAAASIARHVLDRRQRIGLLALGRDPAGEDERALLRLRPSRDRGQLTGILSVLGRVQLGPSEALASVLAREKENLHWGTLVVLITPDLAPDSVTTALGLRSSGFEVCAVLVGRGARPGSDAAALTALGFAATSIRSEADIGGLRI
jgi:uncharacterized protein (DUF58 family)